VNGARLPKIQDCLPGGCVVHRRFFACSALGLRSVVKAELGARMITMSAAGHCSTSSAPRPHRRVHTAYTQRQRLVT